MTRRRSKQIISAIIAVLALLITYGHQEDWWGMAGQAAADNQPGLYAISRFVDGDTIVVDMNGQNESIRMIGIDTPETHKPNTPVQCYGPAAAAFTKNLIGKQKVRLESDPESQNRDRYNRLLRYVYLADGRLIAEEVIKSGHGFAYTQFPFTKSAAFTAAEEDAKQASRGLWGNCKVEIEPNGRKQTAPMHSEAQ